jgi:hypothetical protein
MRRGRPYLSSAPVSTAAGAITDSTVLDDACSLCSNKVTNRGRDRWFSADTTTDTRMAGGAVPAAAVDAPDITSAPVMAMSTNVLSGRSAENAVKSSVACCTVEPLGRPSASCLAKCAVIRPMPLPA